MKHLFQPWCRCETCQGHIQEKAQVKIRETAKKRLSRLPTPDVLNWADQAGTGIARALDDYRRLGDPESLVEALEGVSAVAGAIDVLNGRHSG